MLSANKLPCILFAQEVNHRGPTMKSNVVQILFQCKKNPILG